MRKVLNKSVVLIVFMVMVAIVPVDAQIIDDCVAARLACAAAQAAADHVCDNMNRWWCNLARRMADAVCDEADDICNN